MQVQEYLNVLKSSRDKKKNQNEPLYLKKTQNKQLIHLQVVSSRSVFELFTKNHDNKKSPKNVNVKIEFVIDL